MKRDAVYYANLNPTLGSHLANAALFPLSANQINNSAARIVTSLPITHLIDITEGNAVLS